MKVVNLDKFKRKQKVILEGNEYEIFGVKTKEFFEEDFEAINNDKSDFKTQVRLFVDTIIKHSDIPEEILLEQELEVLMALIQVMQGQDPEAGEDSKKK